MSTDLARAARAFTVLAGLVALGVLVIAACYSPEELERGAPLAALGLRPAACPGCGLCGLSRAFSAALRLDLERAKGFHAAVLPALACCTALAACGPWLLVRSSASRSKLPELRLHGPAPGATESPVGATSGRPAYPRGRGTDWPLPDASIRSGLQGPSRDRGHGNQAGGRG